jgi:hypothetical protein
MLVNDYLKQRYFNAKYRAYLCYEFITQSMQLE